MSTPTRPTVDDRRIAQLRTRAELLIRKPPLSGVVGEIKEMVLLFEADARSQLDEADDDLRDALRQRRAALDRLRDCRRAIVGTGQIDDPITGRPRQYLRRPSAAVSDPLPAHTRLPVLRGEHLRIALLDLLRTVDGPIEVRELHRLLVLDGYTVEGRPSQTISNALSVELKAGTVRRTSRGRYETATEPPEDAAA